jgi:isopentenyl-diphosphate delta-isomerase
MQYTDDIEVLDLVNLDDEVIGTVNRGEVGDKEFDLPGNVRAVDCFIVNSKNELFIPRRGLHKKFFPGGLDFSCAEHVQSGESYNEAMIRGFKEELGLDIDISKLVIIAKINLRDYKVAPYFDTIYVYISDETPSYPIDEYISHEWLDIQELKDRLEAGESAKSSMKYFLPFLEEYLDN